MRRLLLCLPLLLLAACATTPGAMTPEQQAEGERWVQSLHAHIRQRIYYPRDPNRPGIAPPEGRVMVRFTLDSAGRSFTPQVVESSGVPLLDAAALTIILSSAPMPPPPAFMLNNRGLAELSMPIRFSIRTASAIP